MRTRLLVPLLAALALGVVGPHTALAKREKKPSEEYAEKERKFLAAIGARYVGVAKWSYKNKLFQFAIMDYETVLKYDPSNKDARKYLGHVRSRGKWVVDPSKKPTEEQNKRPEGWTDRDMEKLYEEREKLIEQVRVYAGKKYADLGLWCRKKGLELQARKAFDVALKNDKNCEKARKALGHVNIDGVWLTPKQAKAREEAREGKWVEGGSIWEQALGLKLNKAESAHFRIETVLPGAELKRFIKECETTYAYFLRDFGDDPLKEVWPGRKARLLVLGNEAQWHAFVDRFVHNQKEFTRALSGTTNRQGLTGVTYNKDSIDLIVDSLVHRSAHFLVTHYLHLEQPWIQEGFAYYYTVKVLNSTRTHCVAWDPYSNARNDQDWGDSQNWKDLLKEAVRNKDDFDLRMLMGLKITGMKQPQAVKAWGVITWFFDHHREAFMKWLKDVAAGKSQDQAFQDHFGQRPEDLDQQWRDYILENW
jgi:tetratricopeptide (TPR) repeat protein